MALGHAVAVNQGPAWVRSRHRRADQLCLLFDLNRTSQRDRRMPIPGYPKVRGWCSGVRGAGLLKSLSCLYALPIHGYGFKPFSLRILVIGRNIWILA